MFIDTATLVVKAGKGGNGISSFRRERWVAKGGPDGGDGGRGGDVVFLADHNLNTLLNLRHQPQVEAESGGDGGRQKKHGKNGQDVFIRVPVGTLVWENNHELADLKEDGQSAVVAQGGRGGFGNAHFTSSTRQAPEIAEVGEPGETKDIRVELKLLADVGLVGLPNAGKSTLLSVVSNAKPAIADYPFTTLVPNLGVVEIDSTSFLMADIPGLIEGASKGKGLGDDFLRHVERTAVLLHLIDGTDEDVAKAYKVINQELKSYPVDLSKRPQIVVLTKIDAIKPAEVKAKTAAIKKLTRHQVLTLSAVAHKGLTPLLRALVKGIEAARVTEAAQAKTAAKTKRPVTITLADDPNAWWVEKERGKFVVKGQKIEGFARRTNYQQAAGLQRLRNIMNRLGIDRELVRLGIRTGDVVVIAAKEFKW